MQNHTCQAATKRARRIFKECFSRVGFSVAIKPIPDAHDAGMACMWNSLDVFIAAEKGDCTSAGYRLRDATRYARQSQAALRAAGLRRVS